MLNLSAYKFHSSRQYYSCPQSKFPAMLANTCHIDANVINDLSANTIPKQKSINKLKQLNLKTKTLKRDSIDIKNITNAINCLK